MKKIYIFMIMAIMPVILAGCVDGTQAIPEIPEIPKKEEVKFI